MDYDIIKQSIHNIKKNKIKSINDIQNNKKFIISMSNKMKEDCDRINEFLKINVYNNKKLRNKRLKVEEITTNLFKYFIHNFNKLPKDWSVQKKDENQYRIICDYISGMTDRYAFKLSQSINE